MCVLRALRSMFYCHLGLTKWPITSETILYSDDTVPKCLGCIYNCFVAAKVLKYLRCFFFHSCLLKIHPVFCSLVCYWTTVLVCSCSSQQFPKIMRSFLLAAFHFTKEIRLATASLSLLVLFCSLNEYIFLTLY